MTSIIISPTQSGKTKFIQDLSHEHYTLKKSVFIVLRNITGDLIQFCKRWNYSVNLNNINFDPNVASINICLSNIPQLSKMYCNIEKIAHNFIIILDEADLIYLDKTGCKQSTILYDEMYKNKYLEHKYYVTATPFSLFKCIPELSSNNVYSLEKHSNYIGFQNIQKWHIFGNSVTRLTKPEKFEECSKIYMELIDYVLKRKSHQIVLFNCTSLISIQEKLGKDFFETHGVNIVVDHGQFTTVYSKKAIFNKPDITPNGYKYQFKKIHIKEILKLFKQNDKDTKIIIVSGIKAGRGQSYKTEDLEEWHLTDLIYIPPKITTCDTIIQACGRITGIYNKINKSLHIWTSEATRNSILEYINCQEIFLDECKKHNRKVADIKLTYNGTYKLMK